MEEDKKKKKKGKKKKNKQASKPKESVTLDARESTSDNQDHVPDVGHDNESQHSAGVIRVSNSVGRNIDIDRPGQVANGSDAENLAKAQEISWLDKEANFRERMKELQIEKEALDKEANFRERMKELQIEKEAQIQKEATLEEKIKKLLKEKDEILQKEAAQEAVLKQLHNEKNESMLQETSLKDKFSQLEKEKDDLIQKEGSLEQKIHQLQQVNEAHQQKEAGLKIRIIQLEDEKDSWVQKEAGLDEKINHLVDEAAVQNLKVVSLQEKIKQMERERDSSILRENSAKESIASLNNENTKLRAQVLELDQSSKNLLEEKKQLEENISSLQLQINNLETTAGFPHPFVVNKESSEDGVVNHEIEAARAKVEKLTTENSELVGKVNELYAELDRRGERREDSLSIDPAIGAVAAQFVSIANSSDLPHNLAVGDNNNNGTAVAQSADRVNSSALPANLVVGYDNIGSAVADSMYEASKSVSVSSSSVSLEEIMIGDQRNGEHLNEKGAFGLANTSKITEVDEIVQIPIDENGVTETNLKGCGNDKGDVSLIDAPLIGAPFRLISFVARYVSGTDLVNKKNTGY